MGLWWKNVNIEAPSAEDEGVVWFAGEPGAMSKRIPILWRFFQNYHLLKVNLTTGHFFSGYFIYFASGNVVMRCRKNMITRYVGVRIGPEPVRFWVENKSGVRGKLLRTQHVYSSLRRRPVGIMNLTSRSKAIQLAEVATFI